MRIKSKSGFAIQSFSHSTFLVPTTDWFTSSSCLKWKALPFIFGLNPSRTTMPHLKSVNPTLHLLLCRFKNTSQNWRITCFACLRVLLNEMQGDVLNPLFPTKTAWCLVKDVYFFWENTSKFKEIISEVLESLRMEKKQTKTSLRRSQPPKHFKMHLTSRCAATASDFSWGKTWMQHSGVDVPLTQ